MATKRKLTPEEVEDLVATPAKVKAGTPSLFEIEEALKVIGQRYPIDAWVLRRRLKWLVRRVRKDYDVEWTTPWDK